MQSQKDYTKDIAEIRSMMERSSKFLSLSGWAGIMVGIYALVGVYISSHVFDFNPADTQGSLTQSNLSPELWRVIWLAIAILLAAVSTSVFLSFRKAHSKHSQLWNPTAKRLLVNMAVPLVTGGLLIIIMISKGLIGLIAPLSLMFYGLALYGAGKFTYEEIRSLGIIQIILGLVGAYYTQYAVWLWALGFGVFHIIYGIYLHYKYER